MFILKGFIRFDVECSLLLGFLTHTVPHHLINDFFGTAGRTLIKVQNVKQNLNYDETFICFNDISPYVTLGVIVSICEEAQRPTFIVSTDF
jgi:hypothetical protein